MDFKLARIIKKAEDNVYSGVNLLNGTIVFFWTLLCLLIISRSRSSISAFAAGAAFYLSLVVLCIALFKDIRKYMVFPKKNEKMPVFIGHKLDTILIYPILVMALIGIINNMLAATGFFQTPLQQMSITGSDTFEIIMKFTLLPLVAFSEELLNLLLVSFFYSNMKPLRNFRLIGSILSAALIFGTLHSFGWGMNASIAIGISYIPVFLATVYTGNIWISFLAHLYNDFISLAKSYNNGYHMIIIAAVTVIPVLWAFRTMLRKTQ